VTFDDNATPWKVIKWRQEVGWTAPPPPQGYLTPNQLLIVEKQSPMVLYKSSDESYSEYNSDEDSEDDMDSSE